MRPTLAFAPFLFVAACTFPQHLAEGVQDFTLGSSGLAGVDCQAHNGDITVVGLADASELRVRVRCSVRGHSEEEARANLQRLSVRRDTVDGWFTLAGIAPDDLGWSMSPSFDFTIEMPAGLAARLRSHNGAIDVRDHRGQVAAETHNGRIDLRAVCADVRLTTHNGDVQAEIGGEGPFGGRIESHNGEIVLRLAPGRSVAVDAATHNGDVELGGEGWRVQSHDDEAVRAERGPQPGRLVIRSHNGDVTVR